MRVFYDGSFEGFLSLVYEAYYQKLPISSISKYANELLLDAKIIATNEENAQKVLHALKTKFEPKNFEMILNIFLCDSVEFELDLFLFIKCGFASQRDLGDINLPFVFRLQNLQKELFRHKHKMTGFTRFVETDSGLLYAKIETKFDVAFLLGKHFIKRFNNQNFIIHDINRKIAFVKIAEFSGMQNVQSFEEPILSQNEMKFDKLWKTFFENVAIKERKNHNLQRQMVPLLYRVFMNEFD